MQSIQNEFCNHLRQEYNQQLVTDIKIYKQSISNLNHRKGHLYVPSQINC